MSSKNKYPPWFVNSESWLTKINWHKKKFTYLELKNKVQRYSFLSKEKLKTQY